MRGGTGMAEALFFWLIACVLVPMLTASIYSLIHARRSKA